MHNLNEGILSEAATEGIQWKDAFRNFTKFTEKQSRFFNKVAGLRQLCCMQLYSERGSGTDVFMWILWNF